MFCQGSAQRSGQIPDALAATAYDAAHIMFDAIKRANSLDGKAVRDALAATKDFPGVTGTVNFNADRDAVKPIMMIRVDEGGKYVIQERVVVEGAAMPSSSPSAGANTNTNAGANSNASNTNASNT